MNTVNRLPIGHKDRLAMDIRIIRLSQDFSAPLPRRDVEQIITSYVKSLMENVTQYWLALAKYLGSLGLTKVSFRAWTPVTPWDRYEIGFIYKEKMFTIHV